MNSRQPKPGHWLARQRFAITTATVMNGAKNNNHQWSSPPFAGQQHGSGCEVPPCGGGRTPQAQLEVKRGALRAALKSSEWRQVQVVVMWGAECFEVLADGHLSESVRAITCDAANRDQVQ